MKWTRRYLFLQWLHHEVYAAGWSHHWVDVLMRHTTARVVVAGMRRPGA